MTNINPPKPVRAALYLAATFATPTVVYLSATDVIGTALTVLLSAYITLVMGLAVANTAGQDPPA